jgi:Transposase domain (DUF772)
VLRTTNLRPTMWEELLPAECRGLPAELAAVDRLLDDERFFVPYRCQFDPELGRPSIPIETYVRMMWLKFRYRLGFETLCREVSDSLAWRRFCRIPLGERGPHRTTLMKIIVRPDLAIVGIDLASAKQAAVVADHDSVTLGRRMFDSDPWVIDEILDGRPRSRLRPASVGSWWVANRRGTAGSRCGNGAGPAASSWCA